LQDFTEGKISKQILMFSLPMLIGNVFQQLYSLVDAMVVGNFVSGDALAAVGVSMSILMFVISALIGLTSGSAVLISQFFGAKQFERLKRTVSVSIIFLTGLAVVVPIISIAAAPALLRLLKAGDEIFDDAVVYMRLLMGGMIFPVFYNMYTAYLRALGNSRTPLYFLIFSTILNTGLDVLFVAVFDMGVKGAAIATILSQMAAALLCVLYVYRKVPVLQVRKLQYDKGLLKAIIKYGAPAAFQQSIVSIANMTITRLINSFGPIAMAGITAATRIDQLAIMPVGNLAMALSTFVGQNMGAGLEERAKKGFRTTLLFMLVISVFMSALMMAFSRGLISLFLNSGDASTPEILQIGGSYLSIMVIFYFLFAFLFSFNGFFRGAGDAVIAMVFPIISLGVRALAAHALVNFAGMGPEALAWSIPMGWGLSSLGSWVYYKKRLWAGKVAAKAEAADLVVS